MKARKTLVLYFTAALVVTGAAFAASLAVGRYPIDWTQLAADGMDRRVFLTLRLPRTVMALTGRLCAGALRAASIRPYFKIPLASPDIIGVSSGASAGAAAAILLLGGGVTLTALLAFGGGMAAVAAVLALARFARQRGVAGIVLAGIAVNALTQSLLMLMKLTADPEKQLAAIEFWTMGSFADVTLQKLGGVTPLVAVGLVCLFLLNRQILLLGLGEEEARMLGRAGGRNALRRAAAGHAGHRARWSAPRG